MLNDDGKYYYTDDFMFFDFKNINSERYNLFRVNEGESSYFYTNSNFTSQYTSPDYQTTSYYLGTKESQKTFDWKCAAEGLSSRRVEEMLLWLQPGEIGMLRFDGNIDWGYWVVVDQISNINKFLQADDTYIVEFSIIFKTIGTNYAQGYYSAYGIVNSGNAAKVNETAVNEYGIPEIVFVGDIATKKVEKIYISQIGNKFYTFQYNTDTSNGNAENAVQKQLKIEVGEKVLTNYSFEYKNNAKQTISYNTSTGLTLLGNSFIENMQNVSLKNEESSVSNVYYAASQSPVKVEVGYNGTTFTLVGDYNINASKKLFLCATKIEPTEQSSYGDNFNAGSYPVKYITHIWYDIEIGTENKNIILKNAGYGSDIESYQNYNFYIGYYDEYSIADKPLSTTTWTDDNGTEHTGLSCSIAVTKYNLL